MNESDDFYDRIGGVALGAPVRILLGHHDEATAYVRGRACYWIERRPGWGQRMCQQTAHWTNVHRWGYKAAVAMFLDDDGDVRWAYLPKGATAARIESFARRFAEAMADAHFAAAIKLARECAPSATTRTIEKVAQPPVGAPPWGEP